MIINKLFLLSKYFNAFVSFIIVLIIGKTLSLANFGEFAFFKLMTQYLLFSELGMLQYLFRQYSAKEEIKTRELNQVFSYLLISFFTVIFIFYITGEGFINFFSQGVFYLYTSVAVFISLISKFTIDQLRIRDKINTVIFLETLSNLILLSSIGLFAYYSIEALNLYLIALSFYLTPFVVYMLFNSYMNDFIKSFKFNFNLNKSILSESSMLFFYGIVSLLFFSLDRLFIKFYFGFDDLGLYSFSFTIVMGFYMIIQNIFWLNTPNFIHQIKTKSGEIIQKKFKEYEKKFVKIYIYIFVVYLVVYLILVNTYYTKFIDTIYIFILIHIYNFFQVFYVFEKHYFITKKLYRELNLILLKVVLFNIVLNMTILVIFNNIYLLLLGSILSHLLYVVLQKRKLKCML